MMAIRGRVLIDLIVSFVGSFYLWSAVDEHHHSELRGHGLIVESRAWVSGAEVWFWGRFFVRWLVLQ